MWRPFEEGEPGHLVAQSPLPVSTEPPRNAFQPLHDWVYSSPTPGLGHTLRSGTLQWLPGAPSQHPSHSWLCAAHHLPPTFSVNPGPQGRGDDT